MHPHAGRTRLDGAGGDGDDRAPGTALRRGHALSSFARAQKGGVYIRAEHPINLLEGEFRESCAATVRSGVVDQTTDAGKGGIDLSEGRQQRGFVGNVGLDGQAPHTVRFDLF